MYVIVNKDVMLRTSAELKNKICTCTTNVSCISDTFVAARADCVMYKIHQGEYLVKRDCFHTSAQARHHHHRLQTPLTSDVKVRLP